LVGVALAFCALAGCTTVSRTSLTATGGSAAPGPAATSGPPATCGKTLKIGVGYSSEIQSTLGAVGQDTSAVPADYVASLKGAYQRIADDVNSTGGLGGCQIELGFHDFPLLSGTTVAGDSQAECSDFAEDQKVFAVIPAGTEDKTLITCLADHKVVALWGGMSYQPDAADFERAGNYLYGVNYLSPERFGPFIDQFASAGFLDDGAKVGILVADDGSGHSQKLADTWTKELDDKGIETSEFTYHQAASFSDIGGATAALGAAILQFKKAGVNRVLFTLDIAAAIFFPALAEGQGFHPRYGLTTYSTIAGLNLAPPAQRAGAVAVSFQGSDTIQITPGAAPSGDESPNPLRDRCNKVTVKESDNFPPGFAVAICDNFYFLQAALAGAGDVTPDTLRSGADALGDTFQPAAGYGKAAFGAGHGDAVTTVRTLKWNEDIKGWDFVSEPITLP
jgi:hypothetical protein